VGMLKLQGTTSLFVGRVLFTKRYHYCHLFGSVRQVAGKAARGTDLQEPANNHNNNKKKQQQQQKQQKSASVEIASPSAVQPKRTSGGVKHREEKGWQGVVTAALLHQAIGSAKWVLGLDINTNTTGFTILHADSGRLVECGVIDTKKIADLFDKAAHLRDRLAAIHTKYTPVAGSCAAGEAQPMWIVGIEDFLKGFGGSHWRTRDITKLACLNSLVSYECWNIFGQGKVHLANSLSLAATQETDDESSEDKECYSQANLWKPFKVHPGQVKAYFGIRKSSRDDNVKELSFHRVKNLFPSEHTWIVNSMGRMSEKNYDIVDSFLVAHFTRRLKAEETLFSNPSLWTEFYKAWLLETKYCTGASNLQPDVSDVPPETVEDSKVAAAQKRRQRTKERQAKKALEEDLQQKARTTFRKAIAVTADIAFPAPA